MDLWIKLALLVLVAFVVWRMLQPRYTLRIVMDPNGIQRCEGLPQSHRGKILDFLNSEIAVEGHVTVCARRESNGRLRLDFRGPIDPGERQRIRNFLINLL